MPRHTKSWHVFNVLDFRTVTLHVVCNMLDLGAVGEDVCFKTVRQHVAILYNILIRPWLFCSLRNGIHVSPRENSCRFSVVIVKTRAGWSLVWKNKWKTWCGLKQGIAVFTGPNERTLSQKLCALWSQHQLVPQRVGNRIWVLVSGYRGQSSKPTCLLSHSATGPKTAH